ARPAHQGFRDRACRLWHPRQRGRARLRARLDRKPAHRRACRGDDRRNPDGARVGTRGCPERHHVPVLRQGLLHDRRDAQRRWRQLDREPDGLPGQERAGMSEAAPLLEVRDLDVTIGATPVVDGVSFTIRPGETLALVGESGCGKSLTARAVMGLLPPVARRAGAIALEGRDIAGLDERAMTELRGDAMSMIFQEPVASLNPLMTVGDQIIEALLAHRGESRRAAQGAALAMLQEVGIADGARRMTQYPFELSGGMCQRVMIAIALICRPRLVIADEPTTALDVTIQAQILALIKRLRQETGTGLLLITHDMGVVADMADRVCVMYAGRVVEEGDVFELFRRQRHPYTKLLLRSLPPIGGAR